MTKAALCGAFLVALVFPVAMSAQPYSVEKPGLLVEIDIAAETVEPIGLIGDAPVVSLAFTADGVLYGVEAGGPVARLITVDPATAAWSVVGPLGVDVDYGNRRTDLAEDEAGQLWMLSEGTLYRVDRETGTATFDCAATYQWVRGLAFLGDDMITAPQDPDPPEPGCGLEFLGACLFSIDQGPDGYLYGLRPGHPFGLCVSLIRVNPATGESEIAAAFHDTLIGLAFPPAQQPPTAVPALDGRGVAVLVVLLAGAAIVTLRRLPAG